MKRVVTSIGLVVLSIALLGVTSGCGKRMAKGSSGADYRVAQASLKNSTGEGNRSASRRVADSNQTALSQDFDHQASRAELTDSLPFSSSDPGDGETVGKGKQSRGLEGNHGMLATPASASSPDYGDSASSSGLSSQGANGGSTGLGDFAKASDGLAPGMTTGKQQRKGVTFSNGLRDIYFEFDSWRLSEESRRTLEANAQWLKTHPHERITIEGHCDERGTQAYNYVLGEKRASMVQQYLSFLGVPHHQLIVTSFGKDRPKCYDFSESCFQENRRAHFDSDVNMAAQ